MIDKLSTILFLIGIMILIFSHIKIIHCTKKDIITTSILVVDALIFLVVAWVLREIRNNENYDYNYAIQSGKLVGGTVYASYPQQVGGLGWVL